MKKNIYLTRFIMAALLIAVLLPLEAWGRDYIYAIDKSGGDYTFVYVLSGENDFSAAIDSFKTILPRTDSTWEFLIGDYNQDGHPDIYAIDKKGTQSGKTDLHVLDGATGFRQFLRQTPTILNPTDDTWAFALGDYDADGGRPDLYAIARHGTNKTDLYILKGAADYAEFRRLTPTVLNQTDDTWAFALGDYDADGGRPDVYAILKKGGASGKVELHVLKGAADYAEFRREVATGLPQGESWAFALSTQRANRAPACMDGIDNDGDGKIDWPADPGCQNKNDNDETNPVVPPSPQCSNGKDDDGDGKIDLKDPGCTDANDNDETDPVMPPSPQCSNGKDDDDDGKIDLKDPGCKDANDNDETDPPPTQKKAQLQFINTWIDPTAFPSPGQAFVVYFTFVNYGDVATKPFTIRLVLDAGTQGEQHVDISAPSHSPGIRDVAHYQFPSGLPDGDHIVEAYLDFKNEVDEYNESLIAHYSQNKFIVH